MLNYTYNNGVYLIERLEVGNLSTHYEGEMSNLRSDATAYSSLIQELLELGDSHQVTLDIKEE